MKKVEQSEVMPKRGDVLSPTEWELMKICWESGEVSARQIYDASIKKKQRTYGAVNTMLERLVKKNYLSRRWFGPIWLYTPLVSKASEIARTVDRFVHTVMDHSLSPIISHFAQQEKLSAEEIQQLKAIIQKYEGR